MERARRPQPAPRTARAPKPEARTRAASLAVVATAAIAIAACLSAAPPPSTGGADAGGAIAPAEVPQGGDATAYQGHPWLPPVLAPAYAQGDAYVITDLGNTFKLDIEQPPGINWTQVLLDRIAESEDRSRRSVDDLRTATRGVTDDIRRAIDDYIRNNTALLNDRERRFAEYVGVTNITIADLISQDQTLNASINNLVNNMRTEVHSTVYQTILDKEAAVSAIASQVHYIYYDNPALIMECTAADCTTKDVEPFMSVSPGSRYTIYNDPGWPQPSVYAISPIHYNARYTGDDTLSISTIPGNHLRLYNEFVAFTIVDRDGKVIREAGPNDKHLNILVWGCFYYHNGCASNNGMYLPRLNFEDRRINTPEGYPYHVNMLSKETAPLIPPGYVFRVGEVVMTGNFCGIACTLTQQGADLGMSTYNTTRAPFNYNFKQAGADRVLYATNELVGFGLGERGKLAKYFSSSADRPALPVSQTSQTWPNCAHLPTCSKLSFAFDNFVPVNSSLNSAFGSYYAPLIPDSWLVFVSPQLHVTTWDSNNAVGGVYSTSPQFIDRMHKRIVIPTFTASTPPSEAGKLYDVRGHVRIPFAPETPMNVSHVSLRPSSSLVDLERLARDYVSKSANKASNLYNIQGYEFEKMGLLNCEAKSWYAVCDKRGVDPHTLDTTWSECRLQWWGSAACTTLSELGRILVARSDYIPESNAKLPYLEGVYSDALYVPLVPGYTGFRLVIDGVAIFTEYKDVRSDSHIFITPPKSAKVGKVLPVPIHHAEANVTATAQVVSPRAGTMSILAVVSATGTIDIRNEYHVNVPRPPPPRIIDPLSATMVITKNGQHYATKDIGINEHPSAVTVNQRETVNWVAKHTRQVVYDYPSFVFTGTTTIPVDAGDHILFELVAKIDGEMDPWRPSGQVLSQRGISSAEVRIDAASIIMGVG